MLNPSTGNCINETSVEKEEIVCPEGKYLNPLTNRCKNIPVTQATTCKEGYYLNPETGRCKKVDSGSNELQPCADGYERNPETNRCRKINTETKQEYPVEEIPEGNYDNPKIFIAIWAIIAIAIIAAIYVIIQFRYEIRKIFLRCFHRLD